MPTPTVTLYTPPTCPDCRALKVWPDRQGISHNERDLTDAAVATAARTRYGVRVAPITVMGDPFFFGTFADPRPQRQRLLADSGQKANPERSQELSEQERLGLDRPRPRAPRKENT